MSSQQRPLSVALPTLTHSQLLLQRVSRPWPWEPLLCSFICLWLRSSRDRTLDGSGVQPRVTLGTNSPSHLWSGLRRTRWLHAVRLEHRPLLHRAAPQWVFFIALFKQRFSQLCFTPRLCKYWVLSTEYCLKELCVALIKVLHMKYCSTNICTVFYRVYCRHASSWSNIYNWSTSWVSQYCMCRLQLVLFISLQVLACGYTVLSCHCGLKHFQQSG